MTTKLLGLSFCVLSISGCFHDDSQTQLNHRFSGLVTGEKTILGKVMHVAAFYFTEEGAAGSDKVFFTGDDAISNYNAQEGVGDAVQKYIRFISPGQDGAWFTDDDVFAEYSRSETTADGTVTSCNFISAGNDRQWFTGDDSISSCNITTSTPVDGGGRQDKTVIHIDAGADGIWSTSDDSVEDYRVSRYDSDGELAEWLSDFRAGDDGILNTADDQAGLSIRWRTLSNDSSTNTRTRISTDTWNKNAETIVHSDLTITQMTNVTLSNFGRTLGYSLDLSLKSYTSPGPDGEWLTPDDVPARKSSTEILNKSETAIRTRRIEWAPGPNGVLGDADDAVESYSVSRIEIDDMRTHFTSEYFTAAGPDGEWFTEDDELTDKYFSFGYWPGRLPGE